LALKESILELEQAISAESAIKLTKIEEVTKLTKQLLEKNTLIQSQGEELSSCR
jgi:hypothetical protein